VFNGLSLSSSGFEPDEKSEREQPRTQQGECAGFRNGWRRRATATDSEIIDCKTRSAETDDFEPADFGKREAENEDAADSAHDHLLDEALNQDVRPIRMRQPVRQDAVTSLHASDTVKELGTEFR
jgi:hypothetical protein